MKTYLAKLFDSNWFFLSLLGFVFVLPLSHAMVSIMAGVLLFTALIEDSRENKLQRFQKRKILLLIPAIFGVYLISSIYTIKTGEPFYDLKKTLFFIVFPLAFIFGKTITKEQRRFILTVFTLAVLISTIVAILRWWFQNDTEYFAVHKVGLISHIRFSFQLILVIWFLVFLLQKNYDKFSKSNLALLGALAVYFMLFLFFQQSLTGLVAFGSALVFYFFTLTFKLKKIKRYLVVGLLTMLITLPFFYVFKVVNAFYNIEEVKPNDIEKLSSRGNKYNHDFNSPLVENGYYVSLYVCEKEMREEWNKISIWKYDSTGVNGYTVSSTLIRYLTSIGLRKDADGILAMKKQDILNVENGIANIIYQSKKYSLYPRIYQTVWEYYIYTHTGNANYQSFSQRIEFSKAAILIIKENIWLGVGTGHWKEAFRNAYQKNNANLKEELYASSHNQYLNYLVKFGIIGFTLIMIFLIYPVISTKSYTDKLFLIFLVFMFCANLADSNFESHMGSSFFLFFYCLFVTNNKQNYLRIDKKY